MDWLFLYIIINNFTCFRKKISKHGQQRNKMFKKPISVNDELRIRTEKGSLELLTEGLIAEISCPWERLRMSVWYLCCIEIVLRSECWARKNRRKVSIQLGKLTITVSCHEDVVHLCPRNLCRFQILDWNSLFPLDVVLRHFISFPTCPIISCTSLRFCAGAAELPPVSVRKCCVKSSSELSKGGWITLEWAISYQERLSYIFISIRLRNNWEISHQLFLWLTWINIDFRNASVIIWM